MKLRLGYSLERSLTNGPGERFALWVQGCSLACPGCYNPGLFNAKGGTEEDPAALARRIEAVPGLRGISLLGGEPLEQPEAVAELLSILVPRLDRVLYTGYTWEEVSADPAKARVAAMADLVIAGRYLREHASESNLWVGSDNKTLHFLSGRIQPAEVPEARVEAFIRPDGSGLLTGFPPDDLVKVLAGR